MPNIGNQLLTQLVELTAPEVQPNDIFLIVDISANESKKIQAYDLALWLNASGSLYAIYAVNADTASYILGSEVHGTVISSSYSNKSSLSDTASFALLANSSSYALTASFAMSGSGGATSITASYLLYSGVPNGTASYAITSFTSNTAQNAIFLLYNSGSNNGTASYAITTQNVQHSTTSDTASYVAGGPTATASYALYAQQSAPGSSSYLIFSSTNGTSSYAMAAQVIANIMANYGIFLAYTQSVNMAQLDDVDILWSTAAEAITPIEAMGTVIVPFTSSVPTNGIVYLSAMDRNTGFQTLLDSTPISVNVPIIYTWDNQYASGTIETPFSLMGQSSFYGSYMLFVSSSNNIKIEPTRTVRFKISSQSDTVNSYVNVPLSLSVFPSSSVVFTFTSTDGGPFTDYITGLFYTMSFNKQIFTLDAINQGLTSMYYYWTLNSVTESNFSNNPLSILSGVPNSLTSLSCSNCSLASFYTFQSSSLSTLSCDGNFLTSLPNFPTSMSYINCSNNNLTSLNLPLTLSYLNCSLNQLTSLPSVLPSGSYTFLADNNQIQVLPSALPDTIVTMSMNNNTSLLNFSLTPLPAQLGYLSFNNCPNIGSLPSIPTGVLYLSLQSCSLNSTVLENITANLASSSLSASMISGTVDIRGNGAPDSTALNNLQTLINNGWVALYDM
jgi:hypothetical protein